MNKKFYFFSALFLIIWFFIYTSPFLLSVMYWGFFIHFVSKYLDSFLPEEKKKRRKKS